MSAAAEILATAFGISSRPGSRSSSRTRASSKTRSSQDLGPRPLGARERPGAIDSTVGSALSNVATPTSPTSLAFSAFSSPPASSNTSTASISRSSSGRRKTRHSKTASLASVSSPLGTEPVKASDSITGIVVPRMRDSAVELAKIEPSQDSARSSTDSVRFNGFVKGNITPTTPPDSQSRISFDSGRTSLSNDWPCHPGEITPISSLDTLPIGTEVTFRARIETQRPLSKVLDFLLLRDQTFSVQGVLTVDAANAELVRWVRRLSPESLVQITGVLKAPPQPIRSATHAGVEVDIQSVHLVNAASNLPFTNYKPPETLRNRLGARILDLRHPANQAVFRVRSLVTRKFRETLEGRGFVEINTPKLQPAATESGAAVFKVNYFGRKAFLAQSPQLAKQMAISGDFGRVFEVGPVFRAENSNTHRHLTEYTGLDIEMAIENDYHEVLDVLDEFLKSVFEAVYSMPEVEVIRKRWPSKEFKWLEETLILPFSEGIQMLRDDGRDVEEEDLSTPDEMRLGQLIRDKYDTDYYILDRFPASARPFYTHKDPENPNYTRSFDIFLRGQEICSGGQRIHIADELRANMAAAGMSEEGMEEYLSAFDLGAPPHAGAGLGLERIVAWMLELGDVRYASLFHRDPRSLPERPPAMPHPEADTTKPHHAGTELPLEKLIANYGDASNTSWLDDRFRIWRHSTGAAVGYVPQDKFAIITGDPLCDPSQYHDVMRDFVSFIVQELHLTPIWLLVSYDVQKILAKELHWRTLSCTEEQRVDADHHTTTTEMAAKIRRVEREGIKVHEVKADKDFISRAEPAIENWKASRKGKQVHLTEVRPWVDMAHRRYFAAEKDGKVLAMVVLHRLAPRYGWQVKWALDFPGATNGAIEAVVDHALNSVTGRLTFGAGVSERLTPGEHMGGIRARFLAATYRSIVDSLGLRRKATFRSKFGALGEEVYICYPKHGVGLRDLQQIIKFFQD